MWSGYEARVHVHVSNPLLAVLQVMENWLSSWKNGAGMNLLINIDGYKIRYHSQF